MINRTPKTSRRPPMKYLDQKRGGGVGKGGDAVSSRSFDLLNLIIYQSKKICGPKMTVLTLCYIHPDQSMILFYRYPNILEILKN